MPLIRYDIGDIAEFGEPCDTGLNWPVLNQINGRIRDSITLPNGEFRLVTFFDSKMLGNRKLRDFQIILFDDAIAFLYHVETGLDAEEQSEIEIEILDAFKLELPVVFRRMQNANWQNVWKRREWYRVDESYQSDWTEIELLDVMSDLSVYPN